jgi:hypothetical protein
MGHRIGIGGYQNTGKSFGRRWIPDGENVMILQPSVKLSYLFTGPANAVKLSADQLDEAITKGTRKPVRNFDLVSPEKKWGSIRELIAKRPKSSPSQIVTQEMVIRELIEKKPTGYFSPEHLKGNVILCKDLTMLKIWLWFIDRHLPWVHTVILPDFTHFITEVVTSLDFRNKQFGGDQYKKYLDLAADGLQQFITSADDMREDLTIITEYHVEFKEQEQFYELFIPGGKMLKEKFLPSSYYDVFLFTEAVVNEMSPEETEYFFITRRSPKYPEARSAGLFTDFRIPNNLQTVLSAYRQQFVAA